MYQRRGKVRADSGRLQAKQVTGVALGSASKSGGKQRPEPAPPTSSGKPQVEMRRPSVLPGTYKAPEDEKERTKKQLESITGRMFQVRARRRVHCAHSLTTHIYCLTTNLHYLLRLLTACVHVLRFSLCTYPDCVLLSLLNVSRY